MGYLYTPGCFHIPPSCFTAHGMVGIRVYLVHGIYPDPDHTPGSVSHQRYRPLKIGQLLAEVLLPRLSQDSNTLRTFVTESEGMPDV